MLKIITILLSFFLMTTEIKAQNDNALASQMLGTWLLTDLDLEVREEYKNDAEAQKMLATMRNRQKAQQAMGGLSNSLAFTFMEQGQLRLHGIFMNQTIEGTWKLKENFLEIKADDSPIESAMNPSKIIFKGEKMYLGLLSGNGSARGYEKYLTYFVCEKITPKELETIAIQRNNIPEETVYIVDKEIWTVASKKAECNIEGATSCLQIKKNDSNDWIYLPDTDTIEGFEYKEGFEYTIEVEATYNVSYAYGQYKLLKLIQKKKQK